MNFQYIEKNNIIFIKENADSSYWDNHWNNEKNWIDRFTKNISLNGSFVKLFQRYLPVGASILEAGCGRGQFVYALSKNGYNVLGVDYAETTVKLLNEKMPELNIRHGDVTNLKNIPNSSYDAYYSGGVIEHFWKGYGTIISEAHRVLKEGGHLIITFPFMSAARKRIKGSLPNWKENSPPKGFYQFALDPKVVVSDITNKGFKLLHKKARNGSRGFTDIYPDFPIISLLHKSKNRSIIIKILKRATSKLFSLMGFGHTIELVFVKTK